MTADQMSVRELRHDKPSGWFSKSRGLSASVTPAFNVLSDYFNVSLNLVALPNVRTLKIRVTQLL